jgi:hypothetical protein
MNAKEKAALQRRAQMAVALELLRTARSSYGLFLSSVGGLLIKANTFDKAGPEDAAIRRELRRAARLIRGGGK